MIYFRYIEVIRINVINICDLLYCLGKNINIDEVFRVIFYVDICSFCFLIFYYLVVFYCINILRFIFLFFVNRYLDCFRFLGVIRNVVIKIIV